MTSQAAAPATPTASDAQGKPSARLFLAGAFVTAFCVIFLEIVLFQMLLYVSHYLSAQYIISIALLGIALGGLLAFYLAQHPSPGMFAVCGLLFPLGMAGSFVGLAYFSSDILNYSLFLMAPFVCGSLVLSLTFSVGQSNKVYFADLAGAAAGVLAVCACMSLLREEGSLLLVIALSLITPLLYARRVARRQTRLALLILTALLLAGDGVALGLHIGKDSLNMGRLFSPRHSAGGKVFRRIQDERYLPARIRASQSSVVARIDVISYSKDEGEREVTKVAENGDIIDSVRKRDYRQYKLDPRIAPAELIENPDTLIIGSSLEGVLKPVRALGSGDMVAVEINPAVVKLGLGQFYERSGRAYENYEIHVIDGRSYLKTTDRKFDYITLMNAHFSKGRRSGKLADPEYLHTYEAYSDYLDHLTDRGALLIEERIHGQQVNRYMILRSLYTFFKVLRARGIEHPEQHIYVYDWDSPSGGSSLFLQMIIKKQPFTRAEVELLNNWLKDVQNRTQATTVGSHCRLLYSPFDKTDNLFSEFILSDHKESFRPDLLMFLTTDDRPFQFHVFKNSDALIKMLRRIGTLALLIFVPIAGLFVLRHRSRMAAKLPSVVFFAALGVGYILLEIVFMQRFQHFLGNPVYSLAVILGSMLFFSGLGSYLSRGFGKRQVLLSILLVIGLLALDMALLSAFLERFMRQPLALKIVLAVLAMAPVSLFMGVPFPYGLNVTKADYSDEYAALMFGLNGVFCALGTPLSMLVSTSYGFTVTFAVGAACYALALLCALGLRGVTRATT